MKSTRTQELREIVARFDLNQHPLYVAWRGGTLPVSKLQCYAGQYEGFVALIPKAWERLGEPAYSQEERRHHELWLDFAAALGSEGGYQSLPQTRALVGLADSLFETKPEGLGALYAFEVQQPGTARIKLDGLRKHYGVGEAGERYFVEHADKWHEVELLDARAEAMPESDFERAKTACALLSAALWCALDGVWYQA